MVCEQLDRQSTLNARQGRRAGAGATPTSPRQSSILMLGDARQRCRSASPEHAINRATAKRVIK
jgi:hypothetical protein